MHASGFLMGLYNKVMNKKGLFTKLLGIKASWIIKEVIVDEETGHTGQMSGVWGVLWNVRSCPGTCLSLFEHLLNRDLYTRTTTAGELFSSWG